DRVEKSLNGAVVQQFWRFNGYEAQIHLDAVALVRADQPTVRGEGKPPLVVRGDHFLQLLSGDGPPVTCSRSQQIHDRYPAFSVKRDADFRRLVAEHK